MLAKSSTSSFLASRVNASWRVSCNLRFFIFTSFTIRRNMAAQDCWLYLKTRGRLFSIFFSRDTALVDKGMSLLKPFFVIGRVRKPRSRKTLSQVRDHISPCLMAVSRASKKVMAIS